MDRPRARKTLSLERESLEPLSDQDVRDSVMDRHTFDIGYVHAASGHREADPAQLRENTSGLQDES